MKRITAFTVLAAFAAALLLAMLPATPARAEAEPTVGYSVTFTKGSSIVSVSMYFQATDSNHSIAPLITDDAFPDGYFNVKEATDSQGGQLAFTRDGSTFEIGGRGRVNVIYDIDLNTLGNSPSVSAGVNDPTFSPTMPHRDDDYVFITGGYLLLQPWWQGPESIGFDIPEGWGVWSGWQDLVITGTADIMNGVLAGDAVAIDVGGSIPLTVVQPRSADPANLAAQQEFADKLAAQVNLANEAWGKPGIEGGRLQVCLGGVGPEVIDNRQVLSIPFSNGYDCIFVPVGARENILSTDLLLRAGDESIRVILGGMSGPNEPDTSWFKEGCVHYSNLRFAQRNQWIRADDLYDRLGTGYTLYVDALAQSGTSLAGAGEQTMQEPFADLLYSGGTIATASIDARLAEKGKSLDGFISYLDQNPREGPFDNQRLLDELWAYAGVDMSVFFDDYITGTATIPASAFSQLKLEGGGDAADSDSATAGTDIGPAPAFGRGWILMLIAVLLVFIIPFLMEPFALRPRGGAVTVSEEELEAERLARKKAYWGERHGEGRGEGEEGEKPDAAEPDQGGGESGP